MAEKNKEPKAPTKAETKPEAPKAPEAPNPEPKKPEAPKKVYAKVNVKNGGRLWKQGQEICVKQVAECLCKLGLAEVR
jgi:hypothetical protein